MLFSAFCSKMYSISMNYTEIDQNTWKIKQQTTVYLLHNTQNTHNYTIRIM